MRVLVTGGAGYLGCLLVPQLLNRGHQVVLFDKFVFGPDPILHFCDREGLEIISADVRDAAAVRVAVKGCDAVVHLAAIVGYPACAKDEILARSTNVDGTRNVVEALGSAQMLVFASTGSTYGKVDGVCTEDTPINPLSLYGETKALGEAMVVENGGVALRFATVFGLSPRLRLDLLVNDFVYKAVHDRQIVLYEGHFRRTFIHARDAVAAILFALDHYAAMAGDSFNVGSSEMNYTKRDIACIVRGFIAYFLYEADVGQDMDKRDYEVSYRKLADHGFRTRLSIEDGVRELLRVMPHIHLFDRWRNA